MRKKPYTTSELFDVIVERLTEQKLLPDILDYSLSESCNKTELTTYEFNCIGRLEFGGSEGIYLTMFLEVRDKDGNRTMKGLGTFKTLNEDRESFRRMGQLEADFIFEVSEFVNKNIDDFEWEGFNISFYEGEKYCGGFSMVGESRIKKLLEDYKDKYEYAILTDNKTKKQKRVKLR